MKNFFKRISALAVMPAAVTTTLFSFNIAPEQIEPKKFDRPYVVEVVDASGKNTEELKGVSDEVNPFSITEKLGAKPFIEDKFTAFPDIKMGIGSKITLYRAPEYKIKEGKKETVVRSWTDTVENLFTEKQIEIGKDDRVNFPLDAKLDPEMNIVITRVAITQIQEKKPIDFQTIKKDDNTMDQGKTKVQQAGQKGTKLLTYEVHREDGEEVSRKLLTTEITKKPVDEVILIGTKPVITVRCKYNDTVIDAALKYGTDANALCSLMMKESNGNPTSGQGSDYQGLFQYTDGFWASASAKAGFSGANIFDPKAQIYTTAWAFTHGQRSRWP